MVRTTFTKTENMSNGSIKMISQHIEWIFILNKVLLLTQKIFTFNQPNVSSDILSEKNE